MLGEDGVGTMLSRHAESCLLWDNVGTADDICQGSSEDATNLFGPLKW